MSELAVRLAELHVDIKSVLTGEATTDGWHHDAWQSTITYKDRSITVAFKTGIGLRKTKHKLMPARPVQPSVADVVSSLMLDASACEQAFEDWCSDFGYDPDSRKQLESYLACQSNGIKLQKLGLPIAELSQLEH